MRRAIRDLGTPAALLAAALLASACGSASGAGDADVPAFPDVPAADDAPAPGDVPPGDADGVDPGDDAAAPADDSAVTDAPDSDAPDTDAPGTDDAAADGETPGDVPPDPGTDGTADADAFVDATPPACEGAAGGPAWPTDVDRAFLRGPYLQDVRDDHAWVVFRPAAKREDEGCVEWSIVGTGTPSQRACVPPDAFGQYAVRLDGLPGNVEVYYTATAGDLAAAPMTFRTAPGPGTPQRILVLSDIHASAVRNATILGPMVDAALAEGIDFLVTAGDSVSQPEEVQFDDLLEGLRPLGHRVPFWMTLGNHESRSPNYFEAWVLPEASPPDPLSGELYYDFRRGNAWIGVLEIFDFQLSALAGEEFGELQWLRSRLASPEARSARWRLLFVHEPPRNKDWAPCESDSANGEEVLKDWLLPLAKEGGVHAIFSGHAHAYGRGIEDGVAMMVVGGGGGDLDLQCPAPEDLPQPWVEAQVFHRVVVETGCDALSFRAVDVDGNEIDRFDLPAAVGDR